MIFPISAIILVTSAVKNIYLRRAHRDALKPAQLRSFNIVRVFLLAGIPKTERRVVQSEIKSEHFDYNDIVQGIGACV